MNWQRVRSEFDVLVQQPAPEREHRLRELATTDRWLAEQLRDLLQHDATAGQFLERQAVPPSTTAAVTGAHFGRYKLIRPIGSGGMGTVWEAEQQEPHRCVALKLLTGVRSPAEQWRFRHEAQVLASLNHPAIATFHEAGSTTCDGAEIAWLVMELIDGARDVLTWADERSLDRTARINLFLRLCDAVAYGHRRGVLHRDLKPSNVLVDRHGALKLIDFGIARAVGDEHDHRTHTGEIVGTLHTMAPEQLRGQPDAIGTPTDVYALGVLLYRLLCGRAPFAFEGKPWPEVARLVLETEPLSPRAARPDLPADLGWILLRCLAKEPHRRYPTVDALVDDLERFRTHLPIQAAAPSAAYRASKFVRRHRIAVAMTLVLTTGLGVATYGLWRGAEDAHAGERAAVAARTEAQRDAAAAKAATLLAEAAKEEARQREQAALRADALSREVLRVTFDLFDGIEDTEQSRDLQVHELLSSARLDERATKEPAVEQMVREVRGNAFDRLHRPREARAEYERAVALQPAVVERSFDGPTAAREHGLVLDAELGRLLVRTDERGRGEAMLQTAVDAVDKDVAVETRRRVLRTWCRFTGEENRSADLLETARELRDIAASTNDRVREMEADRWIAEAATALDQHDDAKTASLQAWQVARELYGDSHWITCSMLQTHVTALHRAGELDQVEALYPQLLELTARAYGERHPNVLMVRNNQVHLLMARGKRDEASAAMRGIVDLYTAIGGAMTTEHLTALHNLGMVLNLSGKFAEAEPLLAQAAAASRSLCGPDNPEGAMMRFNHGACLAWNQRLSEAEPVLLAEYKALCDLLPTDHVILQKSRRTISDAYRKNGKPDEAKSWAAK